MTDINDIRREIDRLHAKATPGEWQINSCGDVVSHGRFTRDVRFVGSASDDAVVVALVNHWPTISAALAEAESDRRKAAVCDDLLRAYSRLVNGTIMADSFACEAMRIAKTAITAALAAKEKENA